MWDGESGRKAYHDQCCGNCCNCKRHSYKKPMSASLKAELEHYAAVERLKLIKIQLGIKEWCKHAKTYTHKNTATNHGRLTVSLHL